MGRGIVVFRVTQSARVSYDAGMDMRRSDRCMRRGRGAVARAIVLFVISSAFFSGCSRPIWYLAPDLPEKKAVKDDKPIFYYFRAFDSAHHRNMLRDVLWNNRVEAVLRGSINLDLEYGFYEEQQERYDIRKPQVCLLAAPDGTRLTPNYELIPVPSVDAFLTWLKAGMANAPGASGKSVGAEKMTKPEKPASDVPATPMQSAPR